MYFDSIQQLVYMDGHGAYVWSAFIITIVVMLGLIIKPLCQKKQELKNIRLHIRLQEINKEALKQEDSNAPHS